ncbi:hypothetical protein HO133_006553 [Letharia lupina]|uniref:Myb-like domain-containing protein n=1 Tax=Letharia lupina TaxID=560253 RepID=A0A8H6C6S7_9LECA|nr:uncharacterized protein HO133_006553 [Letharia lupina]KAF6217726.1 hypothetical protein HO133_006553 [Letharia lupina]
MPPLFDANGQPVKLSFFDLFLHSTTSRSGKGTPVIERKKPQKAESPSTETSPKSTQTTESGSAEWTKIEEMGLLGMKALNKSWKEISEVLAGKDEDDIKKKYRELYVDAPASIKPKKAEAKKKEAKKETEDKKEEKKEEEKEEKKEEKKEEEKEEEKEEKKDEAKEEKKDEAKNDEAKAGDERKKITEGGKKGGKEGKQGKKGQRGQKGQQGKEKAEEAKPEEVKVEEVKPEENDGILKAKVTAGEKGKGGELKSINGHPVIFVDDDEELEFEELLYLYGLNARFDEQKWITVDSKFFDRFGKRVGAEKLKEKLAGSW